MEVAGPQGVLDGLGCLDHVVPVPAGSRLREVVAARAALHEPARGADLVHAHGLTAGWLAASLRRRPPLVVTVHNLVLAGAGPMTPILRALEGSLPARVDSTVATSDQVARRFTGVAGAGRVTVIPPAWPAPVVRRPPVEVRTELSVGADQPLVLTVARLHPQKGLDILIEAVEQLHRRLPSVRWVVLGTGPAEAALRQRIEQLGLVEVVTLAGRRATVADEMAAADVVAIPSRWESGPLVGFEAMHLGRPVVSTAVGAMPQIIDDGISGRLVPVGDATALSVAIESVLADPAAAAVMGEAGRRAVTAHLDQRRLVDRLETAYQALLRSPVGGEGG